MANKSAILAVRIISDARDAAKGFDDASSRVDRFAGAVESAAKKAALIGAGMLVGAKSVIDSASELQQSVGGVEAVFKDNADVVKSWGTTAAENFGLANSEFNNFATLIGSQLKNAGVPLENLGDQTKTLIGLGADLSAMYGGSASEAVEALSSALKGEMDPIERYGVTLTAAAVSAELAARGQDKLTGSAASAAKAQATVDIIMRQAADAQGAFAREAETAAGQQQRANAAYEDAKAALGTALLPAYTDLMTTLKDVAGWVQDHTRLVGTIAAVVAGAVAAILGLNAAIKTYRAVSTAVSGTRSAISAASLVLGRFRDGWQSAAAAQSTFSGVAGTLGGKVRTVATAVQAASRATVTWVAQTARSTATFIAQTSAMVAQRVATLAGAAATKVAAGAQKLFNAAMNANPIVKVVTIVLALVAAIVALYQRNETFRRFVNAAWAGILRVITAVWDGIVAAARKAWEYIGPLVQIGVELIKLAFRAVVLYWTTVWNTVRAVVTAVWNFISPYVQAAIAGLVAAWQWIASAASTVWNGIQVVIQTVIAWATAYIQAWVAVVTAVWGAIRDAAAAAWTWIQGKVGAVVDWIRTKLEQARAGAAIIWAAISAAASAAWSRIQSVIAPVISWVQGRLEWLRNAASTAWNGIRSAAETVWNGVRSAATSALNAIMVPVNAVRSAFDRVVDAIRSVIDWLSRIHIPSALSGIADTIGGLLRGGNVYAQLSGSGGGVSASPFSSRTAGWTSTRAGATSYADTTNINVTGGLDSSDAIARRIESVLAARRLRQTGATVLRRGAIA